MECNQPRPLHLLTLAAKSEAALADLVQAYQAHLANNPQLALADLCYTANTRRSHFPYRLAITTASIEELQGQLARLTQGKRVSAAVRGQVGQVAPKIAFFFTGQGAQYPDMGRQLYRTEPIFRQTIDECAAILAPDLDHSLHEILYPTQPVASPLIHTTQYAQPALFAVEYALAQLWRAWGVKPDVVLGHSTGEYVAACVAGVFSLAEGLRLIVARARLIASVSAGGATAAVFANEERVGAALAPFSGRVSVAGINAPEETLIAGPADAVDAVLVTLKAMGIDSRRLEIPHAPHSALMDPVLDEFEALAQGVTYQPPQCKLISNVTGEVLQTVDATYWRRHMREAVRFSSGIRQLEAEGCNVMVEIGPQPVLLWLGKNNWRGAQGVRWLPSLWPIRQDWEQMLQSVGELYVRGVELDWAQFNQPQARRRVILPTYPFQRQHYWITPSAPRSPAPEPVAAEPLLHPLLGRRVDSATFQQNEVLYETQLGATAPAYLNDHRVYAYAILPTTAYWEMALQAGRQLFGDQPLTVENVAIQQALILPEAGATARVQILLTPATNGYRWQIYAAAQPANTGAATASFTWQLHAEGALHRALPSAPETIDLAGLQATFTQAVAIDAFYASCERGELHYGPTFRLLKQLWVQGDRALGRVVLTKALAAERAAYQLHPALMDACLQVSGALFLDDEGVYLPIGVDRLDVVARPDAELWCEAQRVVAPERLHSAQGEQAGQETLFTINLRLYRPDGTLVATVTGLQVKATTQEALTHRAPWQDWFYAVDWEEQALTPPAQASANPLTAQPAACWLIFANPGESCEQLTTRLRAQGAQVVLVHSGAGYRQIDDFTVQIDPAAPADYQTLLDHYPAPTGVVHGWSVAAQPELTPGTELSAAHLEAATFTGCGTLLLLLQALTNLRRVPPLWLVTQGAVACPGAASAGMPAALSGLAQSTMTGMAKVIRLEYPSTTCVQVDLDPQATTATSAQALLAELSAIGAEAQIAYRNDRRYVARLARPGARPGEIPEQQVIRADGTYLITGGLGALGLLAARWLVEAGATHLLLLGRSQPNAAAQATLTELRQLGATVTIAQVDVADAGQMAAVLRTIDAAFPLRGVIHAAGVLDDGALINQLWSRFTPVLAPKMLGAWHLHCLTKETPLDFFVLFSSVAALLGSAGQANHAAANAFLDALAHTRRSQGLPALSINWGAWANVGQAAGYVAQLAGTGMSAIAPAQGVAVLAHLLGKGQAELGAQVGVVPLDWRQFGKGNDFFQRLTQSATSSKAQRKAKQPTLLAELAGKDQSAREQLLVAFIQAEVAQILQHDSRTAIDPSCRFRELGMDSLTSMELRNRLQAALDCALPAGIVFNFPAPDALAAHLVQTVFTALAVAPVHTPPAPVLPETAAPAPSLTMTAPLRMRTLTVRGFTLNLCEWGAEAAPVLLCQHGIMDQGTSWETVAHRLVAQGYRVLAPDLRGHGHSDHVGPGGSYHLYDFVGDLDGILEQLALAQVTLVGHSLGSLIAALYVAAHPQRVQQMLLVEPILPPANEDALDFTKQLQTHLRYLALTAPLNGAEARANGTNGKMTNGYRIDAHGAKPFVNGHMIMPTIAEAADRLGQISAMIPYATTLRLAEQLTTPGNGGLVWRWDVRLDAHDGVLMAGLTQRAYLQMLADLTLPVQVIYGDKSGWLKPVEKAALQAALPHAAPVVLRGGHNLHLEAADTLAETILQQIERKRVTELTR